MTNERISQELRFFTERMQPLEVLVQLLVRLSLRSWVQLRQLLLSLHNQMKWLSGGKHKMKCTWLVVCSGLRNTSRSSCRVKYLHRKLSALCNQSASSSTHRDPEVALVAVFINTPLKTCLR